MTAIFAAAPPDFDETKVGPCHIRRLPDSGDMLLTNDVGNYCMLSEGDFREFLAGRIAEGSSLYEELKKKGFFRQYLDFKALTEGWQERHSFLNEATRVHVVSVSRGRRRMSPETADQVVARIFETPSRSIDVEFRSGESLANWAIVRRIIEKAESRNHAAQKELSFAITLDLSRFDEEQRAFLTGRRVAFRVPLHGPAKIHDLNRRWVGGASHKQTVSGWAGITGKERSCGPEGVPVITRASLAHPREIVDEYARLGARNIGLRPLTSVGVDPKVWKKIGYSPSEFLAFYRAAMERIIEINLRNGADFVENTAKEFLIRILRKGGSDLSGAAIGQVAYDADGSVYINDEARALAGGGDDSFRIGDVSSGSHLESMRHPAVRAVVTASVMDGQPQCSTCAYKPYDTLCPVFNHATQGDIMGRMYSNARCRSHMGILDFLFEKLRDDHVKSVFERWIASRS